MPNVDAQVLREVAQEVRALAHAMTEEGGLGPIDIAAPASAGIDALSTLAEKNTSFFASEFMAVAGQTVVEMNHYAEARIATAHAYDSRLQRGH